MPTSSPFSTWVDQRLPAEQAIKILPGMEFAQCRDIAHRDLKPSNVWLTPSLLNRRLWPGFDLELVLTVFGQYLTTVTRGYFHGHHHHIQLIAKL